MKILLGCLSFKNFTGSEIYFYELANGLSDLGHEVHLYSKFIGEPLKSKCKNIVFETDKTIHNQIFDQVIFSHGLVIWDDIKDIKCSVFINVIHSEVLELEKPIIDNKIKKYVGIRPSIVKYLDLDCELIYNPFDFERYNSINCRKKDIKNKIVLFPGSIDYLRHNPIKYILNLSEKQNFKVLHVGRSDYPIVHKNFTSIEPEWEMEKYYKMCDIVSGIFLGRTSIEGLLCGKKVLQFDVDKNGKIEKVYWHTEDNLEKFNKKIVAEQMISIYERA